MLEDVFPKVCRSLLTLSWLNVSFPNAYKSLFFCNSFVADGSFSKSLLEQFDFSTVEIAFLQRLFSIEPKGMHEVIIVIIVIISLAAEDTFPQG